MRDKRTPKDVCGEATSPLSELLKQAMFVLNVSRAWKLWFELSRVKLYQNLSEGKEIASS